MARLGRGQRGLDYRGLRRRRGGAANATGQEGETDQGPRFHKHYTRSLGAATGHETTADWRGSGGPQNGLRKGSYVH